MKDTTVFFLIITIFFGGIFYFSKADIDAKAKQAEYEHQRIMASLSCSDK